MRYDFSYPFHTSLMPINLSKVSDRTRLKPRRDPYWHKVRTGCYLGFRKMTATSDGQWSARCRDDLSGKQDYRTLGDFSDMPSHQRFDKAIAAAEEWFAHLNKGGSTEVITVAVACSRYVRHLAESSGVSAAKDAEMRFKRWVYSDAKFAGTELGKLRPEQVETWRRTLKTTPTRTPGGIEKTRSDSALNRDMTPLRAALNKAFDDGLVTTDFAWRSKLVPIKNADQRRDIYLDRDQRNALIASADADFADFLRGLAMLPLRPGALAALTTASFDRRLDTLTVGKDKQGKDRKVPLPPETGAFLKSLCRDKVGSAPLFSRADGSAWNKDAWKHPMRRAVEAAKVPEKAVAYSLRHSAITDLIHHGLDTLTVAQMSGTSVAMIEKHYGHLRQEHARKALAVLSLIA